MANYGLPWKGSKNTIAPWIIELLPESDWLVDLMAGGCAITDCASQSGKWNRIIANDLCEAPQVFVDALHGEYKGYDGRLSREEFMNGGGDLAARLVNSYGYDTLSYVYGRGIEPLKSAAEEMITAPSRHERRMAYRQFLKTLAEADDKTTLNAMLARMEGIERIERIERTKIIVMSEDYRDVPIPQGATVYIDPPYRGARNQQYGEYGIAFDFGAFDTWVQSRDYPVFVSEYTQPQGMTCIAERKRTSKAGTYNNTLTVERLFVQDRYAEQYRKELA